MKEPNRLKWDEHHATKYAVPLWLRDQHISRNTALPIPRVQAYEGKRTDSIAIVSFGPSLNDTWEKIREHKYVMSCSGATKFLIERGIVPNWHIAVDPLPKNTEKLIGEPHPDVEYLIASTCHPGVLEHLKGFKVALWHVFDNKEEARRLLPDEEWAVMGGPSVGLRALTMSRLFGFVDFHVFGMDGCFGETGSHAADHPGKPPFYELTEYGGKEYKTTTSMLEVAKHTGHELDTMPDVKATFYGEGLVQALMRDYVPKPVPLDKAVIAFQKPGKISAEYRELNRKLHESNPAYGVGGEKHADTVLDLAKTLKTTDILDYGCGKSRLARALPFHIQEYDPAIPGKEESPKPATFVVTTDVLEHIEEDRLPFVLDDLRRVTKTMGFHVIHTGPSGKNLADGRNAHLVQKPHAWWTAQLALYFKVVKTWNVGPLLYALVIPQRKTIIKEIKPVMLPPTPQEVVQEVVVA